MSIKTYFVVPEYVLYRNSVLLFNKAYIYQRILITEASGGLAALNPHQGVALDPQRVPNAAALTAGVKVLLF